MFHIVIPPSVLLEKKLHNISDNILKVKTKICRTTNLQLQPYEITAVHQLYITDFCKLVKNLKWFLDFTNGNEEDILDVTFYIDEVWFHLSGNVNCQNSPVWSVTNFVEILEQPLYDEKH